MPKAGLGSLQTGLEPCNFYKKRTVMVDGSSSGEERFDLQVQRNCSARCNPVAIANDVEDSTTARKSLRPVMRYPRLYGTLLKQMIFLLHELADNSLTQKRER